jgi:hypothetical protein
MKTIICLVALMALLISMPAEARDPTIDFRDAKGQDIYQWLDAKGFTLERSADDRSKTKFSPTEKGLIIEALKPAQSILMFKKGHLKNYRDVEITWGVNKFPKDASYAKGRRNEAIMFYAFFGTEMIDSGSAFIPNSPYFLALRLCENDDIGVIQKGGYFHKGGRFICVAHPKTGEMITTTYDLKAAFREAFGHEAPPLYAIGLEFDTTNPRDKGTSSAIVESISFPSATYIRD